MEGAQVPGAVPGDRLERRTQRPRARLPPRRVEGRLATQAQRAKAPHRRAEEPAQPHALAAALAPDAAHAVVPVAVAHQRQPVHPRRQRALEGQAAVLEERRGARRGRVLRVTVVLAGPQRLTLEEGHLLVEDRRVAGRGHVLARHVGEPGEVVGAPGAHAAPRRWVPPVQHVAFRELVPRRLEKVRPRLARRRVEERQHVLQLVAEPEGAARLVEARAPVEARRDGLRQQPAVEHQVHRGLGRLDAQVAEQLVPRARERRPGRLHLTAVAEAGDQVEGLAAARRLPEEEVGLDRLAGLELQVHLERGAGVGPGVDAAREPQAREALGPRAVAPAPEELGAVRGEAVRRAARGEEGHAAAELGVPLAGGQQARVRLVELRDDEGALHLAAATEHPLREAGGGQASVPWERVRQAQAQHLERRVGRHEDRQRLREAVALALVRGEAHAVAHARPLVQARGPRGGGPDDRRLFVAQVDHLRRWVEHRVVAPGGEPVLAAVERPRHAQRRLAGDAAEGRVGQHVAPGGGGGRAGDDVDDVLAAVVGEAAGAVVEAARRLRRSGRVGRVWRFDERGLEARERGRVLARALEPRGEGAVAGVEQDSRAGLEVPHLGLGQLVGHHDEDATAPPQPRLGVRLDERAAHRAGGLGEVAGHPLVEQHQLQAHPARAQEALRGEHLLKERRLGLVDAHHDERVVARDAAGPQAALTRRVRRPQRRGHAQGGVGEVHGREEPLHDGEQRRREVQALQPARALLLGVEERPAHGVHRPVLARQLDGGGPGAGDGGDEGQRHRRLRGQVDGGGEAHHRVEHRAHGAAAGGPVAQERAGGVQGAVAAEEGAAVALVTHQRDAGPLVREAVHHHRGGLVELLAAAGEEERVELREPLGLDEEAGEGRV